MFKKIIFLVIALLTPVVAGAQTAELDTIWSVEGGAADAEFSPDGSIIATVGGERLILRDAETGAIIGRVDVGFEASHLEYDPNGAFVAVAGPESKLVKIWDINEQSFVKELTEGLPSHDRPYYVVDMDIYPDGKHLAVNYVDMTGAVSPPFTPVVIWDLETERPIKIITSHMSDYKEYHYPSKEIAVWSDGSESYLAIGGYKGDITVYDGDWNKVWRVTEEAHNSEMQDMEFSSDGTTLASCSQGSYIKIWNVEYGSLIKLIHSHNSRQIFFYRDYLVITSIYGEGTRSPSLMFWDVVDYDFIIEIPYTEIGFTHCIKNNKVFTANRNPYKVNLIDLNGLLGVGDRGETQSETLYPNPTNGLVNIKFWTSKRSLINVRVVNSRGEIIEKIKEGYLEPGEHSFQWNSSKYPSGTYFCRIESRDYNKTLKIIVSK